VPEIAAIHHDSEGKKEAGYTETEYRGTGAFQEDGRMRVTLVRTEGVTLRPDEQAPWRRPREAKSQQKRFQNRKGALIVKDES
jgi:hypothetical protein